MRVSHSNRTVIVGLVAVLFANRQDVGGNICDGARPLLDGEAALVAEEGSKEPVGHVDLDAEARSSLVPPPLASATPEKISGKRNATGPS